MITDQLLLERIIKQFRIFGTYKSGNPFGSGHINDTYKISTLEKWERDYLLQRINHHVFRDIDGLQNNIVYVLKHIRQKLERIPDTEPERQALTLVLTHEGTTYYYHPETGYWRCYIFIGNHKSYNRALNPGHALEAGTTFGLFEQWLSDLDPTPLTETIPGFHNMNLRLEQFSEALRNDPQKRACTIGKEIEFVESHREEMTLIQRLGKTGIIPLRITHNDTKFNNVLLDEDDRGLCVIDLDTVMPGYIHYDFGDAIRTLGNNAREDERDLSKVTFRTDYYEAFCKGFLSKTKSFLTEQEIDHLAFSAQVMTFIIGLRFLTDHLNGDMYFKIHRPGHNLDRARVQFRLIREMEKNRIEMEEIIRKYIKED